MRRIILAVSLLSAVVAAPAGCGRPDPHKPPEIRYGQDTCSDCGMIIAEPRFAAGMVSGEGEAFKFDDIGCAVHYQKVHPISPANAWVHDFVSERWIKARESFCVQSANLVTPMGYGLAAFSSGEDAEAFAAQEKGEKVSIFSSA